MKRKIKKNYLLKNKSIILKPYNEKLVNNSYLALFKNKEIVKFLKIKKKFNLSDAKYYFKHLFDVNKNYFWFIFKSKKNIGTVSLKSIQNKYFIGYMIGYKKYWGKKESIYSQNIIIDFAFRILKEKQIYATCNKKNLSSSFSLIKSGFKLYKKKNNIFFFKLKKSDWNLNIHYKIFHDKKN